MKKIIFTLIAFLLLLPTFAQADGGIMPPPDYWIYETGQKAAIVFQDNVETLVLQTSFQGDAKDFAYIVPTPSKPEVTKISDDIFTNLSDLTLGDIIYEPMPLASGLGVAEDSAKVNVIEEKNVGIYEVKVLTATDSTALYTWLKENNFTYPENKKYILDDYIQNGWYFTTAKISTEAISTNVENKLHEGSLTPLRFVFASDKIIFPLKISAVFDETKIPDIVAFSNSASYNPDETVSSEIAPAPPIPDYSEVPITLYIFADHKKELAGFSIDYANWVKKADIEKLAKDDMGNAWVSADKKMYLTKLSAYMSYQKMTSDLFPDNSKDNKLVGVPSWFERYAQYIAYFLFAIFLLFYILIYWQFKSDNRKIRTLCWVLQIIIFITLGAPLILLYFAALASQSYAWDLGYYHILYSLIITALILNIPLSMVIIMIMQKHYQKKIQ